MLGEPDLPHPVVVSGRKGDGIALEVHLPQGVGGAALPALPCPMACIFGNRKQVVAAKDVGNGIGVSQSDEAGGKLAPPPPTWGAACARPSRPLRDAVRSAWGRRWDGGNGW